MLKFDHAQVFSSGTVPHSWPSKERGEEAYSFTPMRIYLYRWTHLPTGKTGIEAVYTYNYKDFLTLLDAWDSQLPHLWRYEELE
jgi:hypothetical protein